MIKDKQDFIDMIKSFMGQASILTIPKELIHYCEGDINSALLLSQLIYWQDKIKNKEGWIYKTYKDWEDEICLNEYHIRKARKYLESKGILETQIKKANGNPTVHYKLNIENFSESFLQNLKKRICNISRNVPLNNEGTIIHKTTTETTTKIKPDDKIFYLDGEYENDLFNKLKTILKMPKLILTENRRQILRKARTHVLIGGGGIIAAATNLSKSDRFSFKDKMHIDYLLHPFNWAENITLWMAGGPPSKDSDNGQEIERNGRTMKGKYQVVNPKCTT